MKLTIELSNTNAAFGDAGSAQHTAELQHVLLQAATEAGHHLTGRLRDSNGNTVGHWSWEFENTEGGG